MVLPFAAIAGIQTLGAIYDFYQADASSKRRVREIEKQQKRVADASLASAVSSFSQLNRRDIQTTRAAAGVLANIMRQGAEAKGTVTAAGAGAGVEGASLSALEKDFERQQLSRIVATQFDTANARQDIQAQRKSVSAQATSRIQQTLGQEVPRPDLFGAIFNLGTDIFGSYLNTSTVNAGGKRELDTSI